MKTIKLPVKINDVIRDDIRIFSSIVRFSYNRFCEGVKLKDLYNLCRDKYSFQSNITNYAIRDAKGIYKKEKGAGIIFGDFKRRSSGLITKEEYRKSRMRNLILEGDTNRHGNRHFYLDVRNNEAVYKRSPNDYIHLQLPKLRKKVKEELIRVEQLMSICAIPVTFRLSLDHLFITYDEGEVNKHMKLDNLNPKRVMGIDFNPNYIGFSVIEFDDNDQFKVLKKGIFDLKELNKNYEKNKKKQELIEVNHRMIRIAKHYRVSKISVENLVMPSMDKGKGKAYNVKCNNHWNRSISFPNLNILCNQYGFEYVKVNPAYSSFIGNLEHGDNNTPDCVAASIEIARRGYKKFSKEWFYPEFDATKVMSRMNQWKEDFCSGVESWKQLFQKAKKSKVEYRFQPVYDNAVFQRFYRKMNVKMYIFI